MIQTDDHRRINELLSRLDDLLAPGNYAPKIQRAYIDAQNSLSCQGSSERFAELAVLLREAAGVADELVEIERAEAGLHGEVRHIVADADIALLGQLLVRPREDGVRSLVLELERRGVIVSSGSACAAGSDEPSHVLLAIGIEPELAQTAVRFSFSHQTTAQELATAANALAESVVTFI